MALGTDRDVQSASLFNAHFCCTRSKSSRGVLRWMIEGKHPGTLWTGSGSHVDFTEHFRGQAAGGRHRE